MWNVIGAIVLVLLGFALGKFDAYRHLCDWMSHLPEDLRDVVLHAFKEYPRG